MILGEGGNSRKGAARGRSGIELAPITEFLLQVILI